MTHRQTVAILPAGAPMDAALAAMSGLGGVYPRHTLSMASDPHTGSLVVLYDPAAAPVTADDDQPADPQVEIGLGVDGPGDLMAYALSVTSEDQQEGVKAMAAWLVDMLDRTEGAANFISFTMEHPGVGRYAMTLQRCDGQTPAERIAELKSRLDACNADHSAAAQD